MEKYSKYKNSGIEWIGEVPSSWKISMFKHIASVQNGFAFKSEFFDSSNGIPILRIRDITSGELKTRYTGSYSDDYIITKGDLLIGMDGDFNLRWWDNEDALLNQRCCRIKEFENVDKRFLYYVLPNDLQIVNDLTYYTTVKHLSSDDIYNIKLALPSYKEQDHITKYLDHQTGLIDAIIEKKELLIKKLKEQRQAIINEAVTKGLKPNAKMKDSGVEWLGEIPEGWSVMKMKFGCEFILDGTHGSYKRVTEGYRLLSVRNIINDKFTFREDDSLVSEKDYLDISTKFKIQEGDIQLAIVGATLGKVALVTALGEDYVTQRSLATFRIDKQKFSNEFFYYFLRSESFQSYLWLNAAFSAQPGVYLGTLQNCSIPLPEMKDQLQIVNHIKEDLSVIEMLMNKVLLQIKKLKSYRQSIISEAVTGKIDVREWEPIKTNLNNN